ncbi:tetratricopeptide repeat protein [Nitrosospira sp. Nsp14]
MASTLNNLGNLYYIEDQYMLAKRLLERSLGIWQKVLGPEHPMSP